MKNYAIVLVLAIVSLLAACSKDLAGQAYGGEESYSPPYDVFNNNAQIFFVELVDDSGDFLQYNIIVDHPGGIVQKKGYYYTNKWNEFQFGKQATLDSNGNPTQWIESPVQTTILISRQQYPNGVSAVITQSCKEQQGELRCGCKSIDDCGYWMLQSPDSQGACTQNADCSGGDVCIDNSCGKLSELYEQQECTNRCELKTATITTSDGETRVVGPAGGGYTSAEALFWTVEEGPAHCPTQETIVPIKIVKKSYGAILSEEFITLKKGETSSVLDHPLVPDLAFTLEVEDATVDCP